MIFLSQNEETVLTVVRIISVCIILGGLWILYSKHNQISQYEKTTGLVVDFESVTKTTNRDGVGKRRVNANSRQPMVEFSYNNKPYSFIASLSDYEKMIGQNVPVLFDPREPSRAFIHSVLHIYFKGIAILCLGILFFAAISIVLKLTSNPTHSKETVDSIRSKMMELKMQSHTNPITKSSRFPEEMPTEVRRKVDGGDKLGAIKILRERHGLGLKEAKEYIERSR